MRTNLIQIGNSKGVRIPAFLLKECNIKDRIELEVVDSKIILKAINKPRQNWEEAFKSMHDNGNDKLIISDSIDLDSEELEWK